MYHSVARVYIAQNVSKLQRRGRPRPWSLELFCFVFWGSRHWLKNNFAAFMHSFHTHLYKEQRFDTKKRHKIWSQPNFLEVTWPQINFVRFAVNELIFMVRSVTLGGDCDVCYCRHRQRNDSGFLTIASKSIYDHVTSIKKSGCDHIFCRFSSGRVSLVASFSFWRLPEPFDYRSDILTLEFLSRKSSLCLKTS